MHNPRFSITQVLSTTVSGEMTRGHRFTYISVDADVVENTPPKTIDNDKLLRFCVSCRTFIPKYTGKK